MGAGGRGGTGKQSRGRGPPAKSPMPGKQSQGRGPPATATATAMVEGMAGAPQ
jgi:hypothetical protein